jgi:predicted transcriptional regulator
LIIKELIDHIKKGVSMVHYGAILEKAVRNSNLSITALATKLNVNRRSIYYWFERKRLDPLVMKRIGEIIHFDFSTYLTTTTSDRTIPSYQKKETMTNEDMYYWKNKYDLLLNKYHAALGEKRESVY